MLSGPHCNKQVHFSPHRHKNTPVCITRRGHVIALRETVAQVLEEALALFVVILFHAVLKSFQGFALGAGDLFRDLNIDDHILIAAAAAGRMRLRATAGCVVTVLRMAMRSSAVIVT